MKKTWIVGAALGLAVVTTAAGLSRVRSRPASVVGGPAAGELVDEAWAAGQLRRLKDAQTLFLMGDLDKDGARDFASSFSELAERELVDPSTASGAKGYVFTLGVAPGVPPRRWMAIASPSKPTRGVRWLVTNQDGGVHASTEALTLGPDCAIPRGAAPMDPPPDERRAIRALEELHTAQVLFFETDSDHDGVRDYASSLAELGAAGAIDAGFAEGRIGGYSFEVRADPTGQRWIALASPEVAGPARWLCLSSQDEEVHGSVDGPLEVGPDCTTPRGALPWRP